MSAGTGGTIAGVSKFLKERNSKIQIILADPVGSSLLNRVQHGVCFTSEQWFLPIVISLYYVHTTIGFI